MELIEPAKDLDFFRRYYKKVHSLEIKVKLDRDKVASVYNRLMNFDTRANKVKDTDLFTSQETVEALVGAHNASRNGIKLRYVLSDNSKDIVTIPVNINKCHEHSSVCFHVSDIIDTTNYDVIHYDISEIALALSLPYTMCKDDMTLIEDELEQQFDFLGINDGEELVSTFIHDSDRKSAYKRKKEYSIQKSIYHLHNTNKAFNYFLEEIKCEDGTCENVIYSNGERVAKTIALKLLESINLKDKTIFITDVSDTGFNIIADKKRTEEIMTNSTVDSINIRIFGRIFNFNVNKYVEGEKA